MRPRRSSSLAKTTAASVLLGGCAPMGPSPSTAQVPPAPALLDPVTQEPWSFLGHDGVILVTEHFRVRTTVDHASVRDRLPAFLEAHLRHATTSLGGLPEPSSPMQVDLLQDRRQWVARIRQVLGEHSRTWELLGRGGITTGGIAILPYVDAHGRTRDTFTIAAHESWHLYTQNTFRGRLPTWLEEGIATWGEGWRSSRGVFRFDPSANWERARELRRAASRGRLMTLEEVLATTPRSMIESGHNRLLIWYAQVWALVRFLDEDDGGRRRASLHRLLAAAAEGRLDVGLVETPADIRAWFGEDLAILEKQYAAWIERLVRPRAPRGAVRRSPG